ncbi:MAG: phage baseplate assembly protein V [Deltaproteobacteria bacterium]|jgi:phage baseplate assembly protein V|nr:phage baseplate assembly protein V [Deltaproteobacteria bacterium]
MHDRKYKKLWDAVRNASATRLTLVRVDDGPRMQTMQAKGLDGEILDAVERFQNYGFSSFPPAGEAVGLPVGGDRGHIVVVAVDDRGSRKGGLQPGEVAVYHMNGDHMTLGEGNKITMKTKEFLPEAAEQMVFKTKAFVIEADSVTIKAKNIIFEGGMSGTGDLTLSGNLNMTGNLSMTGNVAATGNITATGPVHGSNI